LKNEEGRVCKRKIEETGDLEGRREMKGRERGRKRGRGHQHH
jgi:hypothetical protein